MTPSELVGVWNLRSFTVQFSDGRPAVHPYGEAATGRIVYTVDGFVSAVLSGRRTAVGGDLETARRASVSDKAAWFDSYLSYSGRWHLEDNEVVHAIDTALVPAVVGTEVRRRVTQTEDGVTLSYTRTPASGVVRTFILSWERA